MANETARLVVAIHPRIKHSFRHDFASGWSWCRCGLIRRRVSLYPGIERYVFPSGDSRQIRQNTEKMPWCGETVAEYEARAAA